VFSRTKFRLAGRGNDRAARRSGARSTTPTRDLVGAQVLVIDGDPRIHARHHRAAAAASLHVTCVRRPEAGLAELGRHFYSVVLIDLDTPTPGGRGRHHPQVHARRRPR
jgi:hypothetical protein